MRNVALIAALLTLQACAVLPNKPALRAAVIGVGSALVIGAAGQHSSPVSQHPQESTALPPCAAKPEVCQ